MNNKVQHAYIFKHLLQTIVWKHKVSRAYKDEEIQNIIKIEAYNINPLF